MELEIVKQTGQEPRKNITLLFVPGLYQGAWAFADNLMPFFAARGFDVCAYSPRGHGASSGHEDAWKLHFDNFFEDLQTVARSLRGPVVLVGHSMGGMLVEKYLENDSAFAAVLLCTPDGRDLRATRFTVLRRYFWPTLKFALTGNPDYLYHDRESCRDLLFAGDRSSATDKALARIAAQDGSHSVMKELMKFSARPQRVTTPVLMISTETDLSLPPDSLRARAAQKNYALKMYPHGSHQIFMTSGWQSIADDIDGWLAQTLSRAA